MSQLSVYDCFCGLGGLSMGAALAGMHVVGGVDAAPEAVETYKRIFPESKALLCDLVENDFRDVLSASGVSKGDIDVLIGGPPCQPYSVNNHRRGTDDSRCVLVAKYLELVSALRPEWIVMENVPGFASIGKGEFLRSLLKSFSSRRYHAEYLLVDAEKFGVPQKRRRLVILACRDAEKLKKVLAEIRGKKSKSMTVGEALCDIPCSTGHSVAYSSKAINGFQKVMREKAPKLLSSHVTTNLGTKNMERIRNVPQGGNWRNIPRELLPPGMLRARLSDHTTRYGRLDQNLPSYTLLTKCDPHWGCFVHPTEDRVITVREAARLQSIPDRVQFPSSITAAYKLIGNSVPPLLAKGILQLLR